MHYTIDVQQSERRELDRHTDGVFVTPSLGEPDVLTEVEVRTPSKTTRIVAHWESTCAMPFQVFLVPETATLFLGAGRVSAVIHLPSEAVLDQKDVFLFWGFERRRGYILELGEVECFLYDAAGTLRSRMDVEPPYDVEEHECGLAFVSSEMGTRILLFPDD